MNEETPETGTTPQVSYLQLPFVGAARVALLCRKVSPNGYVADVEGAGCIVQPRDPALAPELARQLSGQLKKADILQIDRAGTGSDATLAVSQWGGGEVVARHAAGLIVKALPEVAQNLVLTGGRVSDLDDAVDIATVTPQDTLSGRQLRLANTFELVMITLVFLLGIMLILVGVGAGGRDDAGMSWVRVGFGTLATLYALWRMRNVLLRRRGG